MAGENAIRTGTKWLLASTLGGQVAQFAFGIVLARILFPRDFGLLVTIQVYTGVAWFFAGAGMAQALLQAKQVEEEHYQVVFTLQLIIGLFIYAIFYAAAPLFTVWYHDPIYRDLIRVSALSFLLRPFMANPSARLMREMHFRETAVVDLVSLVVGGALSIGMARSGYGIWSLIVSGLLSSALKILMLGYVTRWKPLLRFDRQIAGTLGTYGVNVSANSIVDYVRSQVDNFTIGRLIGPSELGIYNKGTSLSAIPITVVSGATQQVILRAMAQKQDNLDAMQYLYLRTITLLAVYTLPFYVGLCFLAHPFLAVVYGPRWEGAAPILQLFALTGILRCVVNPSSTVSGACNLIRYELRIQLESLLVICLGCLFGAGWGVIGVAASVLAGYLYLSLRLSHFIAGRISIGLAEVARALYPALIMNAALALALLLGAGLANLLGLPTGGAAYLAGMVAVGASVYLALFLFCPPQPIVNESLRWKTKLGLAADPNLQGTP